MPLFERGDSGSSMEDLTRALDELTRGVAEANRLTQAAQRAGGRGQAAGGGAPAGGGLLASVATRGALGLAGAGLGAAAGIVGAGVNAAGQGLVSAFRGGSVASGEAGFRAGVAGALASVPVLGELSGAGPATRIAGDAAANTFARLKDLAAAGVDIDDELLNAVNGIETAIAGREERLRQRINLRREEQVAGATRAVVDTTLASTINPVGVAGTVGYGFLSFAMALHDGKTFAQAIDGFRTWK